MRIAPVGAHQQAVAGGHGRQALARSVQPGPCGPGQDAGRHGVVVRSPEGADLDADTLIAWSREWLAGHKYPRRIEFVPELPLGPSGKILKRQLAKDL